MVYQVTLSKKAIKVLEHISEPSYSRVKRAIYALGNDPRPDGYIKLKGRNGYRIRVGDYRVIYEILDGLLRVDVIRIGHRKDIYE